MTKLKTIDRMAVSTWSPDPIPQIAIGSAAGAIDSSFSASAQLEIHDLNLNLKSKQTIKLTTTLVPSKFNRLAWGQAGLIAAGLEHGQLYIWNARSLIDSKVDSLLFKQSPHKSAVKGLDFNPINTNVLATGASDGDIILWDLNQPTATSSQLGNKSLRIEELTHLSWNRKAAHILASASNTGNVAIWDVKSKKELTHLSYPGGRKSIVTMAWNPDEPMMIATAADDDYNPIVLVWDLRNASQPTGQFQGHSASVTSIAWCQKDSDLLMSCGKDKRTVTLIIWNTKTFAVLGDLHVSENCGFECHWSEKNPDLTMISSFDGKVSIHSIQKGASCDDESNDSPGSIPNDDPFAAAIMQGNEMNRKENQPQFQLEQAPKWFKRPSSVSWGFGGRLIIVKSHVFPDSTRISVVAGQIPCHDDDYLNRVNSLKTILNFPSIEYLSSFCQIKAQTDPAEKETWNFMNMLLAPEPAFVSDFLGIKEPIVEKKMNDLFLKLKISSSPIGEEELLNDDLLSTSMIDATLNQGSVLFEHVDALEFESQINVNTPEYAINPLHKTSTNTPPIILSTPLKLLSSQSINKDEAEVDIAITKCVIVGNFESAVKLCLATERLADALAFAIQGGTELLERTQKEYFKRTSPKKSYARLLQGVVYKQAADTVANTDLDEGNGMAWKDVMAYLYTFANQKEITSSLSLMASKLVILVNKLPAIETTLTKEKKKKLISASLFCYMGAGNVEQVSNQWMIHPLSKSDFKLNENFSQYRSQLQSFIEKITTFMKIIGFEDNDLFTEDPVSKYKLESLYEKYIEYIHIISNQGAIDVAWEFTKLIPQYYTSKKIHLEKLPASQRNRIFNSGAVEKDPNYPSSLPFEQIDIMTVEEYAEMHRIPVILPQHQYQQQPLNQHGFMEESGKALPYTPTNQYQPPQYGDQYGNQFTSNNYLYSPSQNQYQPPQYNGPPVQTWNQPQVTQVPLDAPPQGIPAYSQYQAQPTNQIQEQKSATQYKTSAVSQSQQFGQSQTLYGENDLGRSSVQSGFAVSTPGPQYSQNQPQNNYQPLRNDITYVQAPPQNSFSQPPTGNAHRQLSTPNIYAQPSKTNVHPSINNVYAQPPTINSYLQPSTNNVYAQPHNSNLQSMHSDPNGSINHPSIPQFQSQYSATIPIIAQVSNFVPPYASRPIQAPSSQQQSPLNQSNPITSAILPIESVKSIPVSGDRSQIPAAQKTIIESFDRLLKSLVNHPSVTKRILDETEKKFLLLGDQMNNGLLKTTIAETLSNFVKNIDSGNYVQARKIHMELITTQYESSGSWIVGIKQLIDMVERSKIPAHSVSQVQSQSNGQNSLPLQNRQPPQISSTSQAYTGQTIYTNTMNQSQALAPPPIHSRDQMPSQQLQSTYQPRFIPNMNLPQDQMRPPASHQGYHSTQSQISELSLPAQGPLYQQPSSQFQIVPTPQINGQLPLGQTYPGGHYGTR